MGNRKKSTRAEWEAEAGYIGRVDPNHPGGTFNHDPECFRTYVEMQSRFAREDGCDDLADLMDAVLPAPTPSGPRM